MFGRTSLFRWLILVLGLALVLLNAVGLVIEPNSLYLQDKSTMEGVAGYDFVTQDVARLKTMLQKPMSTFDAEAVNQVVADAILHDDKRRIHVFENWILWLGGKFYEPLSRTQFPSRIIAGQAGLCSEVAMVFNEIAKRSGVEARLIQLQGHVVSEVKTADGWRVVDPDFGISYPMSFAALQTAAGPPVIRQLLGAKGYDEQSIQKYVETVQTSENNAVGEIYKPSSPRLHKLEQLSEWLKWFIPALLASAALVRGRESRLFALDTRS